jgi:type IV secretory pathway TrbF-like protein
MKKMTEIKNPFLSSNNIWNNQLFEMHEQKRFLQIIIIAMIILVLVAMSGLIYLSKQSKWVPYLVEVDPYGKSFYVDIIEPTKIQNPRIIQAQLSGFISDSRTISSDHSLMKKSIFRIYSMLSPQAPATAKMNEWLNKSEDSNPFKRSEKELVEIEILNVMPQSKETWQLDWTEIRRGVQGNLIEEYKMRALITIKISPSNENMSESDLKLNPTGIFVQDFSWSKLL